MPGAGFPPLPGENDALSGREAFDIEWGDVETETAVTGRLVHGIVPAIAAPMHERSARQCDREPSAGSKCVDRCMRPPEGMSNGRTTSLIAPPYCTRTIDRAPEMARHHKLDELGMRPDERHRRPGRPPRLEPAARDRVGIPHLFGQHPPRA